MRLRSVSILAVLVLVTSGHAASRPSPKLRASVIAARDTTMQQRMARHCFKECPTMESWARGKRPERTIARDGYVLLHSAEDKIPRWVAEYVTAAQLAGKATRGGFAPDPELPEGERAELSDYRGSGYDRGHCAPAGNYGDQRLKDETFYLSNMTPQNPKLNQQLWRELEDRTREWVATRGGAYEMTGGFFYDPAEEDPRTADGHVQYQWIGENRVAVPTHYYKIIIARHPRTRVYESIAFVAENKPYQRPFNFSALITSVDWIEERTGINFMPNLTKTDEARLEARTATLWP